MEEDFTLQRLYKQNKIQQERIKNLEAKIKSQVHHIELLNQCDDSSTEVIAKMDGEIETLKQSCGTHQIIARQRFDRIHNLEAVIAAQNKIIMNQSAGCEERHNVICGVKEVIDEYFKDA